MDNIDTALRDALRDTEPSRGDGLPGAIARAFERHMRGLMLIAWVKMAAFLLGAAGAAYTFGTSQEVRTQIGAAAAFVVFSLGTGIMFVLYWMQMNRAMLAREIKRLEVTIARSGVPGSGSASGTRTQGAASLGRDQPPNR